MSAALACVASARGEEGGAVLGDARWGMTPARVQEVFPRLEPVNAGAATSEPVESLPISLYRLRDHKVGDRLTCNIQLRFVADKLSHLDYFCRDTQDVPAYLEATYGPPSTRGSGGWTWRRSGVVVSYAPSSGVFTTADAQADRAFQAAAYLRLMRQQAAERGEAKDAPQAK